MDPIGARAVKELGLKDVLYEKGRGRARITLDRPQAFNAYLTSTLKELTVALSDAALDDAIGVIVLTGSGDRAFCTGGDVKEYAGRYTKRPRDYWKYMGLFQQALEAILRCGKPVVARINGMAVGGGNEINLACDLSVMAEHALLKQVGTHVGSVACGGATQWLPLVVGDKRAREILFLNRPIPARQALEWGLVNRVVASVTQNGQFVERPDANQIERAQRRADGYAIDLSRLDAEVDRLCDELLGSFPECMRYTKQQVGALKEQVWGSTIGHAREWLALHFACWEPLEGMQAFVEKRPARHRELRDRAAAGLPTEWPWGAFSSRCPECGATLLPEAFRFCGACGAKLPEQR
jgi:enoyl-CoA hydratase/carnithine racemase